MIQEIITHLIAILFGFLLGRYAFPFQSGRIKTDVPLDIVLEVVVSLLILGIYGAALIKQFFFAGTAPDIFFSGIAAIAFGRLTGEMKNVRDLVKDLIQKK